MVAVYHNFDPEVIAQMSSRIGITPDYVPVLSNLELVAAVSGTDDPAEALTLTLHDDGDSWTARREVLVIGGVRGKRSSQEGDVFVAGDGVPQIAVPNGFRPLPELRLPFLP